MTYTIDCFKNLIEQYPTWAQLRPFLESWEGGRLRIIDCGSDLHLVRYDKGSSNFSIPSTGWFRSVVWNGATNRPLCVGPPKATETEPESHDSLLYEEFYEGVMINAFLENGHVRLVTRSKLDATGTFYSPRSFQSLLMDTGMTLDSIQALLTERGAQFVSLLLQHPEHRIVSYITEPRALVIHTGSVDPSGSVTFCEDQIPPLEKPADMPLEQWARSIAEAKGWQHQGLVIKDGQGSRYRLRSSAYTMVRTLRGDSPRLEARFLKLRQQQLMETYGFYYPEEKPLMAQLELLVRQLTQQLYNFYVCVHIKHSIKFVDLPPYWKTHVYALHSYYLGTLKERRFFIRKQEVIQYMNNLPIPRMLHLLKQRLTPFSTSLEHEQSPTLAQQQQQ